MKSRLLFISVLSLSLSSIAMAQTPAPSGRQSFDEFRKSLFDDYNSFRKGILERYDQFLEGAWVDYQQFKGEEAYSVPKPKAAPRTTPDRSFLSSVKPSTPEQKGSPSPQSPVTDRVPSSPAVPAADNTPASPTSPAKPSSKAVPLAPSTPASNSPASPGPSAPGETPVESPASSGDDFSFSFYEIELQMPETDIKLAKKLSTPQDYAAQWRKLANDPQARLLLGAVEKKAAEMNLNDYLKSELASSYIDSRYGSVDASSRMSLKHFLLANMGYGVRLGINGNNQPLLLIPCKQTVYGRLFIKVDGKKYYVFGIDGYDVAASGNASISTCQLPKNNDIGLDMDLRLNGLNLPYKPHKYNLSFGDLSISGEVNGAMFPMLYRYPQMPTGDFARSYVSKEVRDDVVRQFKLQLEGRDQRKAVDDLLQFVQGAFEYATDDDNHGFEKPYLFEETLFYDKCDCEDRAIFYTYLLWNVLGVENHLINYPGHESAAVTLSQPIKGDAYSHEGRVFYISDPTYIGARTGMCMPGYVGTAPGIDLEYK